MTALFITLSILSSILNISPPSTNPMGGTSQVAADVTNQEIKLDNCSTFYFNHLRENFGYNAYDSCGFVAAGMLLSYYDTYQNDAIIDDFFEVNTSISTISENLQQVVNEKVHLKSPGIRFDKVAQGSITTANVQYQVNELINEQRFFQYQLIKESAEFPLQHNYIERFEQYGTFISFLDDIATLIDYHIKSKEDEMKTSEADSYVSIGSNTSDLIAIVKSGVPVFTYLSNSSSVGHFAIAYDYEEGHASNEDGLIFHMGYEGQYALTFEEIKRTSNYSTIGDFFYIQESKIPHSHSNNYYRNNDIGVCMCSLGTHPNHEHTAYNDAFGSYNNKYHYSFCRQCYATILSPHSITGSVRNGYMCAYCPYCGYTERLYAIG